MNISQTSCPSPQHSHSLIVGQRAVLDDVPAAGGVVPRDLLDLEEVLPGDGGDAGRSAAQQEQRRQQLHGGGQSDEEL